jgi:hypothetical protein
MRVACDFLFLLIILFVPVAFPHFSRAEVALPAISPKLSLSGSLRIRTEFWNWFEPKGSFDNDYVFTSD